MLAIELPLVVRCDPGLVQRAEWGLEHRPKLVLPAESAPGPLFVLVVAVPVVHIDVAVLSRCPFVRINTHRHVRNAANTSWLFSRDCLEVDVDVGGTVLSLYVNHLKSMIYTREETKARRQEQAQAVADIVDARWSGANWQGNFVVVGDMNDYPDGDTALGPLLDHPELVNVVDRRQEDDRYTHYWAGGNTYSQLDYLLLPSALADLNANPPEIERSGLPWRAERCTVERIEGVGEHSPKASDHCPLHMQIELL